MSYKDLHNILTKNSETRQCVSPTLRRIMWTLLLTYLMILFIE